MIGHNTTNIENIPNLDRARLWLWMSIAAAALAIAGSIIALAVPSIYASLTPAFLPQALAQDIVNLAVASPAMLILAVLALRGSLRAYLLWLGVLVFTIYNYVIYTFSVPFGPLFFLWVVVFGLCLYATIGGITALNHAEVMPAFTNRRAIIITAWFLIVTTILFAFIWLSEDIPALLAGVRPQSTIDMNIPTNPVHILDLAFFLPAGFTAGVMLLKKKPLGFSVVLSFIVFLILTGIPILVTPLVQTVRGETAAWGVFAPIGTLTILWFVILVWLTSTIHAPN